MKLLKTLLVNWNRPSRKVADDRRKCKRFSLNLPIDITGFDSQGHPFAEQTKTADISEAGCRIVTDVALSRGDVILIRLILPDGLTLLQEEDAFPFEIAWVAPYGNRLSAGARRLGAGKPWKLVFPSDEDPNQPKPN